ncbi:MAG: CaiB/BaiF CoA transferase family protein [Actinomycetota bacterium]
MSPLDGLKVLDLSRFLSGPYCTMVLADMGADVTKVERFPGGDESRRTGPKVNGESVPFTVPNRNKRSLALDLKSARGREVFDELARRADVVVENFRPGVAARLGIDHAAVSRMNPGIIYCSISGFGQTGPYNQRAGFDIIAQGVTGFMRMTGHPGDRPVKVGIAINDIAAGVTAVYSILGAYIHRLRTGQGQYIDVSLVDAGLAWTVWEAGAYFGSGELPQPTGTRHRRSTPYQAYETADGYVTIGANTDPLWKRLCEQVLERPELLEDPRYEDLESRMEHIDELEKDIEDVISRRTTEHWVSKLDGAGVPGGPVLTYEQALSDPHVRAREMVVQIDHPRIGPLETLGVAPKLSLTPLTIRRGAPLLGEHTTEVLSELGFDDDDIDRLCDDGIAFDGNRRNGDGKVS